MKEVHSNLYVGDETSCRRGGTDTVVHACKHPCHQDAVGYRNNLHSDHPEYLVAERENHLYLNMVDMERKQEHEFMEPMVTATLDFIDQNIDSNTVLVHCNQGVSRSPTLAMLYLAKQTSAVTDSSYQEAKEEFRQRYRGFQPGRGINLYLQDHWNQL